MRADEDLQRINPALARRPDDLAEEALIDGVLVMPFKRGVARGMSYFLTNPTQRAESRKLQAFHAWLASQFDTAPAARAFSVRRAR